MPAADLLYHALEDAAWLARARRQQATTAPPIWSPLPGPQTIAYESLADEIFYGGQAGGGKSDLLLGLARTAHRRAIIFRREYRQLVEIVRRSEEIVGNHGKLNRNDLTWRLDDGRILEFGAVQYADDVRGWQGRPHDFYGFDELTNFTEPVYRFLIGWLRTTVPGQRTRVVSAGNPPTSPEGEWVIRYWAPWLDDQHVRPAAPGELRWFAVVDGRDQEVESDQPFVYRGETIMPRSRTFIPAQLADNPHLEQTGYRGVLQNLPEPLRSKLLYGDFKAGVDDDPWQVIPTAWVDAAMNRWREDAFPGGKMTAVGVDVARGGKDETVLARLWAPWVAQLNVFPGSSTPDGPMVAGLVLKTLIQGGIANVDAIGVGASVYDALVQAKAPARAIIFSAGEDRTDRSGQLQFINARAFAYWHVRDLLDPATNLGVMLPPDRTLRADLVAHRWRMHGWKVQVESKEEIINRLGRSPDRSDAVALALLPAPPPPRQFVAAVGGDRMGGWQGYRPR